MKQTILLTLLLCIIVIPVFNHASATEINTREQSNVAAVYAEISNTSEVQAEDAEGEHHAPPTWSVIPFVLLLLMIATGPLFYEHFWHHNYPKIAMALAAIVVAYYLLSCTIRMDRCMPHLNMCSLFLF